MALSYEQAKNRLENITTKEQLRALINELSVESSGSKTILYSGYVFCYINFFITILCSSIKRHS